MILQIRWLKYMQQRLKTLENFSNIRKGMNFSLPLQLLHWIFNSTYWRLFFLLWIRLNKNVQNETTEENLINSKCIVDCCNWKISVVVNMDSAKVFNPKEILNAYFIIQVQWKHVRNWWTWKHFCTAKIFKLFKISCGINE